MVVGAVCRVYGVIRLTVSYSRDGVLTLSRCCRAQCLPDREDLTQASLTSQASSYVTSGASAKRDALQAV